MCSARTCTACTAPLRRLFYVLFACIVLWISCAVLFYHAVEGWDATHALFFAVNVGFGIGYGFPDCAHAACAWYTSAHCVFGASFVMGALLLGFNLPLEWQRRHSAKAALRRWQQLGGGGACTVRAMCNWIHERRYRLLLLFCWAGYMVLGVIGTIALRVIEGPVTADTGNERSHASSASTPPAVVSVTDAVYFVVTSLATGAQMRPRDAPVPLLFTTAYVFVGVPLFSAGAGALAGWYITHKRREHIRARASSGGGDGSGGLSSVPVAEDSMSSYASFLENSIVADLALVEPKLLQVLRSRWSRQQQHAEATRNPLLPLLTTDRSASYGSRPINLD